jgi:hypothetical protein
MSGYFADLHIGAALQDEIQFVLAGVGVKRVLLARFEGVQTREEIVSFRYGALSHFLRREGGEGGDVLQEHIASLAAGEMKLAASQPGHRRKKRPTAYRRTRQTTKDDRLSYENWRSLSLANLSEHRRGV